MFKKEVLPSISKEPHISVTKSKTIKNGAEVRIVGKKVDVLELFDALLTSIIQKPDLFELFIEVMMHPDSKFIVELAKATIGKKQERIMMTPTSKTVN